MTANETSKLAQDRDQAVSEIEFQLDNPLLTDGQKAQLEAELAQAREGVYSCARIGQSPKESTELY